MTSGIRNLIREQKIHQVYTLIQSGRKYGMMTMNMSLADHYRRGNITLDEAMSRSGDPEDLRRLIEGGRKDASVRL
jgi:twitching motility protein PilT